MRRYSTWMCLLLVGCGGGAFTSGSQGGSASDPISQGETSPDSGGDPAPMSEASAPTPDTSPPMSDAGVEAATMAEARTPEASVAEGGSQTDSGSNPGCCNTCVYNDAVCQETNCTDGGGSSLACSACTTAAAACATLCGGCPQ